MAERRPRGEHRRAEWLRRYWRTSICIGSSRRFGSHGLDRRYGAVLVNYADDFVILCRHGAAEVLETTRRWMTRIGLTLNEDQDAPARRPMRRPSIFSATPSDRCTRRGPADATTVCGLRRRPSRPSGTPFVSGCGRATTAPWEDVVRALNRTVRGWCDYFSYGTVTKARHDGGAPPVPHRPPLSTPPAQDCRVWLSAVSHACCLWGTGCRVAADASRARRCACLDVKPVREPDDRNGHVRFDERGGETERWPSRRERPRKTSLAVGAAGPVRHRALPRLYRQDWHPCSSKEIHFEEPALAHARVQIGACNRRYLRLWSGTA